MVKIPHPANRFLAAHDTKGLIGPWLGFIDVCVYGPQYRPIVINDWPSKEAIPNDIEGICAMPGDKQEYLLVESGFRDGEFGRIIKILCPGKKGVLTADYLGSFRPFCAPQNKYSTPKHEEIEGIAVVEYGGTTALVLALRGDAPNDQTGHPGTLVWGTLTEIGNPPFKETGRSALSTHAIANRGAADLFLTLRPGLAKTRGTLKPSRHRTRAKIWDLSCPPFTRLEF